MNTDHSFWLWSVFLCAIANRYQPLKGSGALRGNQPWAQVSSSHCRKAASAGSVAFLSG